MQTPEVISYASSPTAKTRISFRGAVATLMTGIVLLTLSVALIALAWSIMKDHAQLSAATGFGRRSDNLEGLGILVCVLAALSFLAGMIVLIMGLRGVRQRELV